MLITKCLFECTYEGKLLSNALQQPPQWEKGSGGKWE